MRHRERDQWGPSKRKCMMQRERKQYKEAIVALAVWLASCAFCASTMMYFYGLSHSETVLYPFNSRSEQTTAVWQTAGEAMLCSSWTIWLSLNRKRNPISTAIGAAIGTGLSLSVFAVVGLQSCLSGWHPFFHVIFRSTFFAEYNWLTFILEVAPATSCFVGLLLFWFTRKKSEVGPSMPELSD